MNKELDIDIVKTSPIQGQKPGTSGLRKKVTEFEKGYYLHNFVQSIFNVLGENKLKGSTLVVGGDGRYFNKQAIQIIFSIAAANGVGKILVGQNGLLSTPAISAVVRARKALGAIILTASHNPGGKHGDFGIKYNIANGGPAPEQITNAIYEETLRITELKMIKSAAPVDLSKIGVTTWASTFNVEVIDSIDEYWTLMQSIFDIESIKKLISRPDFVFNFDAMSGVTGVYAQRIFREKLGVAQENLINCEPSEDFNGGHPDPNLTYAPVLVEKMNKGLFDMGCASDGDGDRNMVLGKKFFVNPSDSVALIASHHQSIPYFKKTGLKGLARSMPTSAALDRVAKDLKVPFFEVPTGWKFFGNLMDAQTLSICGEESFGTGSDHIREKDGIWAVLAWLQILATANSTSGKFVSLEEVVHQHWKKYGRNYYSRYDYEEVDSKAGDELMKGISSKIQSKELIGKEFKTADGEVLVIDQCDDFEYKDPIDHSVSSHQGLRILFKDGSRIIYRLSGTGSSGATIRVYFDKYESRESHLFNDTQVQLKSLIQIGLELSNLEKITGRREPNVIT